MGFDPLMALYSVLLGLALGSFMNVCIYRIPLGKSIISPPSNCPNCGERIRFYDNIPLLSYLILWGRCRYCRHPISWRYPLVETLTGLFSLALFSRYGLSYQYFLLFLFLATLVTISFIDLDHQIIPDILSRSGIVIGLASSAISFIAIHKIIIPDFFSGPGVLKQNTGYFVMGDISWFDSLIGIIAGYGSLFLIEVVFKYLTGKEGMGRGDAKLLAMIGAWLGWRPLLPVVMIASLTGAVIGLLAGKGFGVRIPFGPFLAIGTIIYLFFGPQLIIWYYGLLVF
ncbi:MAG: prepilin peptidase [Deltaproteobacteria bacterium]|nr:prepilin peptidase [Deltaproteobacteria bacterium]